MKCAKGKYKLRLHSCALMLVSVAAIWLGGVPMFAQSEATLDSLGLTGANISSLTSLSDPQLEALMRVLDATPIVPAADLPGSGTFWSLKQPGPGPLLGS